MGSHPVYRNSIITFQAFRLLVDNVVKAGLHSFYAETSSNKSSRIMKAFPTHRLVQSLSYRDYHYGESGTENRFGKVLNQKKQKIIDDGAKMEIIEVLTPGNLLSPPNSFSKLTKACDEQIKTRLSSLLKQIEQAQGKNVQLKNPEWYEPVFFDKEELDLAIQTNENQFYQNFKFLSSIAPSITSTTNNNNNSPGPAHLQLPPLPFLQARL